MYNAIGSKIELTDLSNLLAADFNDCIGELLEIDDVKKLDEFHQHANTSRLQHSLNVSYYSYFICKVLRFNYRSAARAGILHDLFLYDWRFERQPEGRHAFAHPKVALRNALNIADLNEIEQDAIVNHMFPLTITFPKYKESYVVTLVDKYCCLVEILAQYKNAFNKKLTSFFKKSNEEI